MAQLAKLHCIPCRGDEPPATAEGMDEYRADVPDWELVEEGGVNKLRRSFKFKNFAEALDFTDRVGAAAEEQDHHPTLVTQWGKVTVTWWTHKIGGLHRNDFVMAARTDELYEEQA